MSAHNPTYDRTREEWMCVECFEDPERRHSPGFASYGEDGELCGYHYGVSKGYYADETATNKEKTDDNFTGESDE